METIYMPALSHLSDDYPGVQAMYLQNKAEEETGNPKLWVTVKTQKDLSDSDACRLSNAVLERLKADGIPYWHCRLEFNNDEHVQDDSQEVLVGAKRYSLEGLDAYAAYLHKGRQAVYIHEPLFPNDTNNLKEDE